MLDNDIESRTQSVINLQITNQWIMCKELSICLWWWQLLWFCQWSLKCQ